MTDWSSNCYQNNCETVTQVMERMRRLRADISIHDSAQRFSTDLSVDVFIGK
jgi:hypothetical protein